MTGERACGELVERTETEYLLVFDSPVSSVAFSSKQHRLPEGTTETRALDLAREWRRHVRRVEVWTRQVAEWTKVEAGRGEEPAE